jgi:hypothetical protein
MNRHESVTYCEPCDQVVAVCEVDRCDAKNCRNKYCPDCRVATNDPDLFGCSKHCAEVVNWELAQSMRPAESPLHTPQPTCV